MEVNSVSGDIKSIQFLEISSQFSFSRYRVNSVSGDIKSIQFLEI